MLCEPSALKPHTVEQLGQCCGPGVSKLEWHHHHYGPIMNQLQCTYDGQLHYGIGTGGHWISDH